MSNWARVGLNTRLRHDFSPFPGADHWAQVTVQIPSSMGCPGGSPGTGNLPYFLRLSGYGGLGAASVCSPTPCWVWQALLSGLSPPTSLGPSPNTPYVVQYHLHGSVMDWFINGVYIGTENVAGGIGAFNFMYLNYGAVFCCCNEVYYTDVRVGTSAGASDIFGDDFSSGNFNNWYVEAITTGYPLLASVVAAPADDTCPSLSISPGRAGTGDPITVAGHGFTPGAPVTLWWSGRTGAQPVELPIVVDGSGSFSVDTVVPYGIGTGANGTNFPNTDLVVAIDAAGQAGCTSFTNCSGNPADGIQAGWDNPTDQNPTNLPDPEVAVAGALAPTHNNNRVLDYIWHDGAHWVLWEDPSAIENAGVFPPPTNHSLNATRISADGSSVTDYPLDTPYQWIFGGNTEQSDPGFADSSPCPNDGVTYTRPVWQGNFTFSSWQKPIIDAHFASDGTTLWVGVLTFQTIPYPWLDNADARTINPGAATQTVPLGALTAGFTSFYTGSGPVPPGYNRFISNTVGPLDIFQQHACPVTDAGEGDSGYWAQPVVCMFAGGVGGFNPIGTIPAKYYPGGTAGAGRARGAGNLIGGIAAIQTTPRGGVYGRVAMCASENDPGVCHVVWSEGGDWGRSGEADTHCQILRWDGGPANRSYRVNYTTWSPSAKATDQELWESTISRDNYYFLFDFGTFYGGGSDVLPTGYTLPTQDQFAALLNYELRNDNDAGQVLLFAGEPFIEVDPNIDPTHLSAEPWLDNSLLWCDTLNVWDISGGSPVLLQSIPTGLFPTQAETAHAWPLASGSNQPDATPPVTASDMVELGPNPYDFDHTIFMVANFGPQAKGFGISRIYDDPLLGGEAVYLLQVPFARRFARQPADPAVIYDQYPMRSFLRVPADMSAPIDYLDGVRQYPYTVIGGTVTPGAGLALSAWDSGDFWSDPRNLWIPAPTGPNGPEGGPPGLWFDRRCTNEWVLMSGAQTPSDFENTAFPIAMFRAACPGFQYHPDSDSVTFCAPVNATGFGAGHLFGIVQYWFCRGCRGCQCGRGIYIAHRA